MATHQCRQPRRSAAAQPDQATFRPVRLAASLATLLLLAACTSDTAASNDPPAATPTLSAVSPITVDPVAAAEQAALEAYRGMWDAYTSAGRPPAANPDDAALERYATGDALQVLRRGLTSMRDQGLVSDGSMKLSPEVTSLAPASSPTSAQVTDCADTSDAARVRADGEPFDDEPGGRRLIVADLENSGGEWKVTSFGVRETGSC